MGAEVSKSFLRDYSSWRSKLSSKYTRLIEETPDEYDRKLYKQNQSIWKSYSNTYEDKYCDQNKSKSKTNNYAENNASFTTDNKTHTPE